MAKRSIEAYRPIGLAKALDPEHRYVSAECIAKLIVAGGPLPDRLFEISGEERGNLVSLTVSARDKIENAVELAATAYHLAREEQVRPTPTQLAERCAKIESSARRLLTDLGVGLNGEIKKMPDALRYGALQAFAAIEAEQRKTAATNRGGYPIDEWWGVTNLRRAVSGVASLRRWAASAKERKIQTKNLEVARRRAAGSDRARNEGDKPLNEYLRRVMTDCWWGVYGREFADGRALLNFARVAAEGVGVDLGRHDAARERIRNVLGMRPGKLAKR